MGIRVIRFASLPVSRWANGLGETVELWRTPADGPFDARLSIATVDTAGPFSALPGIDRALVPLAPAGLTVRVDADIHALHQYETLYFSGDADAASQDVRETGRDLNLMVRRGAGRTSLTVVGVGHGVESVTFNDGAADGVVAVVVLEGSPTFGTDALAFGDTIVTDGERLAVRGRGLLAVAQVR